MTEEQQREARSSRRTIYPRQKK